MKAPHGTDLFRNSIATPSLVASIINDKYNNALPLERQIRAYRNNGINLATNTMANWVIKSADNYLSLLYDRLHDLVYENHIIHADETPVKVIRMAQLRTYRQNSYMMMQIWAEPENRSCPLVTVYIFSAFKMSFCSFSCKYFSNKKKIFAINGVDKEFN